jgi:hypothetical protein
MEYQSTKESKAIPLSTILVQFEKKNTLYKIGDTHIDIQPDIENNELSTWMATVVRLPLKEQIPIDLLTAARQLMGQSYARMSYLQNNKKTEVLCRVGEKEYGIKNGNFYINKAWMGISEGDTLIIQANQSNFKDAKGDDLFFMPIDMIYGVVTKEGEIKSLLGHVFVEATTEAVVNTDKLVGIPMKENTKRVTVSHEIGLSIPIEGNILEVGDTLHTSAESFLVYAHIPEGDDGKYTKKVKLRCIQNNQIVCFIKGDKGIFIT